MTSSCSGGRPAGKGRLFPLLSPHEPAKANGPIEKAAGKSWRHFRERITRYGRTARNLRAEVAGGLQQFIELHRKISQQVEPDFMNLGNSLQSVHADAGELIRQTVKTIGLLGNNESSVLTDLRQHAEQSLQEVRRQNREIDRNLEVAQEVIARVGNLAAQGEKLDKLGLYLGVVGFNIGVESTRATKATGRFSGVAEEVRQLAAKIRLVAADFIADCEKAQSCQQTVGGRIARDLQTLTGLAQEVELAVEEAVACIEEIMGRALAALADANGHAKDISSQIGEVVMRIQLHDSMSQRIAHVVQALTMLAENLTQADESQPGYPSEELAVARQVILLQAGQIERIIGETKEANRNSRLAFQLIAQRVAALEQCFSVLAETFANDHGPAAAGDPLVLLQTAFGRLSRLLAESTTMIGQLYESIRQTSMTAGRLVGRMHDIETIHFEVHIKALNTIIMAAHLGDHGRTMEVLARETKLLADQSLDFAGEVMTIHTDVAGWAQALHVEDNGSAGNIGEVELAGSFAGGLAETMSCFNRESAVAGKQAEGLGETIARAGNGLDFLDRLAAELSGHFRQLVAIAELIAPEEAQIYSGKMMKEGARLERLYTMEKERELHAAKLGADHSGFEEAGEEPAAAGDGGDGRFLVEVPGTWQPKAGSRDGNIELF